MKKTLSLAAVAAVAAVAVVLFLSACGSDPFGAPARVKTHGYRARATLRSGKSEVNFQIAVRGDDRRKEPEEGTAGKIFIWNGKTRRSFELDPATRTYRERPFVSLDEILPGHPLESGFSDRTESVRRGITDYHREGDTVFSGHVCWLWRFDDKPGDPNSHSTTYWVAPDLDKLVLRVDREPGPATPSPVVETTQLTNVRVNASAELFSVPPSYTKRG